MQQVYFLIFFLVRKWLCCMCILFLINTMFRWYTCGFTKSGVGSSHLRRQQLLLGRNDSRCKHIGVVMSAWDTRRDIFGKRLHSIFQLLNFLLSFKFRVICFCISLSITRYRKLWRTKKAHRLVFYEHRCYKKTNKIPCAYLVISLVFSFFLSILV